MENDILQEKILTFIINENNQLLLLKGSNKDHQFHKSFWYVVTGACEKDDKDKFETIKREVKEETNLEVTESIYLNKIFKYRSLNYDCIEHVYLSKVNSSDIILNEEHINYKWCNLDEFIQLIHWFEDKSNLIKLLKPFFYKGVFSMYNNIGKRDILIFPKFNNINIINEIRNKYDRLASLIEPHITLAFPFSDIISNEDLINKLSSILKDFSPFEVTFKGVSLSHDNYIFLNCIKGESILIDLHDKIYEEILPTHLKKSITYSPHITLGQADNLNDFANFDYEFTTIIDTISIEFIGKNEESIIIDNIKL